jgi:tetratricopeptide (TPR) repeat protein
MFKDVIMGTKNSEEFSYINFNITGNSFLNILLFFFGISFSGGAISEGDNGLLEIDANIFIAKAYLSLKKNNLAKAWLFKALQTTDLGAEGCCLLGEISLQENNLSLASFWYRSALCQNNDEKDGRFVDNSYFTIIPSLQLTFIYYKLGEFEKAKYYHEKSKIYDKNNRSVLYNEQFFKSKKI